MLKTKQMKNKSVTQCKKYNTTWHFSQKTIFNDYLCTVGGGHGCWGSCGPAC